MLQACAVPTHFQKVIERFGVDRNAPLTQIRHITIRSFEIGQLTSLKKKNLTTFKLKKRNFTIGVRSRHRVVPRAQVWVF